MVTMLRGECGESTNASMGINSVEGLYQLLRRTQEILFDEFDLGNIPVDTDEDLVVGENIYTFNDAIDTGRISGAWVNTTGTWLAMEYGITPIDYNTSDPEEGESDNTPSKWQFRPSNQFEVWPVPAVTGKIRFRHMPRLVDMASGSTMGTLDANLIVLYAAAERMADKKSASAPLKLKLAERRLAALRYNSTANKITHNYCPTPTGRTLPQAWEAKVPRTA